MQITIGKKIAFSKGETICFETLGQPRVYRVVSYLDTGTCKVRPATRWEILKFKVLIPWRRLKRKIRSRNTLEA